MSIRRTRSRELMAETNPEDRFLTHQIVHRFVRVGKRCWIARTVRKKNSVGIEREHFFSGGGCGDDGDLEAFLAQQAQYVFFDSIIVGCDAKSDLRKCAFASAVVRRN